MADCGTYAGYQAHRKAGEETCVECRRALRVYMADYRKRNPQRASRDLAVVAARDRALRRLAARHPAEFRTIYAQEKAKIEVEP